MLGVILHHVQINHSRHEDAVAKRYSNSAQARLFPKPLSLASYSDYAERLLTFAGTDNGTNISVGIGALTSIGACVEACLCGSVALPFCCRSAAPSPLAARAWPLRQTVLNKIRCSMQLNRSTEMVILAITEHHTLRSCTSRISQAGVCLLS